MCDEYNENIDKFIDEAPISFEPLDVSAKTVNGNIILNSKLLSGEIRDIMRYLLHELTHRLQQKHNDVEELTNSEDYLDNESEVDAFKIQIDYMEEVYNPEEIQKYLDGLMNHHHLRGRKRIEKIKELVE